MIVQTILSLVMLHMSNVLLISLSGTKLPEDPHTKTQLLNHGLNHDCLTKMKSLTKRYLDASITWIFLCTS